MLLVFTTRSAKSTNLRSCARWVHKGVMCREFKRATWPRAQASAAPATRAAAAARERARRRAAAEA